MSSGEDLAGWVVELEGPKGFQKRNEAPPGIL